MGKKKLIEEARRLELMVEAQQLEDQLANQGNDESSTADKVVGGARSALAGLTFHLSEPVYSGLMAAEQTGKKILTGERPAGQVLDSLRDEYNADVARRREFLAKNPGLSLTAEMGGAIAPMIATMGASAPLTAAETAGTAARVLDAANAGNKVLTGVGEFAGKMVDKIPYAGRLLESEGLIGSGARVAKAGIEAAAQAVTQEGIRRGVEEPTGFIQEGDNLPSMVDVAKTGFMFGGGLKAIPEAAGQVVRGAKTAATVLGGVSKTNIEAYLENPEAIRGAKSVAQIKDEVDATVQKFRDDVDNAKLNREQALDALKQAEQHVDDLVKQNKFLNATEKAEARAGMREAKARLDDAFKAETSAVKTARPPLQPDDVVHSVENVKQQVSDLSTESYKILDQHKGKFQLGGVTRQVSKLQSGLKVGGQLLSADSESAHGVLGRWAEKLKSIEAAAKKTNGLSGGQVKRIIQELDSDIRSAGDKLAGEFSDKTYQALMGVRKVLDTKLKTQVPLYAEVMEETAKMNQLRAEFAKMFGKRESVSAKLARIDSPNLERERAMLGQLGDLTGKDFKTPLDQYISLKNRTRTPLALEELKRGLPEHGDYVDAVTQNARLSNPKRLESIVEQARNASPEAQALRNAEGVAAGADTALDAAKGALEPFKRITPQNSENVIRTLLGGDKQRKLELRKLMGMLGEVSDEDFMHMIEQLRVKESFEGRYQNGSANVNMWAMLFGAGGLLSGMDPTLGLMSAGAGASLGRFMDHYGPAVTRRVLDGIIFMRGVPTVQKVNQLFGDLPPAALEELKTGLVRMVTTGNSSGSVVIPPEHRAEVSADFDGADNLDSIEKAKGITAVNKHGTVDSQLMQKLVVGDHKPDPAEQNMIENEPQPKLPPTYQQVTDFVKNRKQERY